MVSQTDGESERMLHRSRPRRVFFLLITVAVCLCVSLSLASGPRATALTGSGHGPGYRSAEGWWLGTYRLDDGSQGFCLNAGKPSPTGHDFDYADAETLGWFTPEQRARLAYISRSWAGTDNAMTAAAGQLATWVVTGLGNSSLDELARRAGKDAEAVAELARAMATEAAQNASLDVHATAVMELGDASPGRVRVDVNVDRLSGSEQLPPASHTARVSLRGATFLDGSDTAIIHTGTDVPVVAQTDGARARVTVSARAEALPYGNALRIAVPRSDAQAVLLALPANAEAQASLEQSGPSPLPFQPVISTVTSAQRVDAGTAVFDTLNVSTMTAPDLLPTWGVWEDATGLHPIVARVESTLHGPVTHPITESAETPPDTPVACTVTTEVTGTGRFDTPSCVITEPGFYVWTERIDPSSMEATAGGKRLLPWSSTFDHPDEVTEIVAAAMTELAATGGSGYQDTTVRLGGAVAFVLLGLATLRLSQRSAHRKKRHTPRVSR